MRPIDSLKTLLQSLNGKDYAAYQSLRGNYAYKNSRRWGKRGFLL
jgi:hypothetical protein